MQEIDITSLHADFISTCRHFAAFPELRRQRQRCAYSRRPPRHTFLYAGRAYRHLFLLSFRRGAHFRDE